MVRLRVRDATKDAVVPWDADRVDANFVFFERAPDAPAPPPTVGLANLRDRPLSYYIYTDSRQRDKPTGQEASRTSTSSLIANNAGEFLRITAYIYAELDDLTRPSAHLQGQIRIIPKQQHFLAQLRGISGLVQKPVTKSSMNSRIPRE